MAAMSLHAHKPLPRGAAHCQPYPRACARQPCPSHAPLHRVSLYQVGLRVIHDISLYLDIPYPLRLSIQFFLHEHVLASIERGCWFATIPTIISKHLLMCI